MAKPILVVNDDYSCEVYRWDGKVETFDLLTPIDFNPMWEPVFSPEPINPYGRSVERRLVRMAKVSFEIRERPEPPPVTVPDNIILGGQDA